MAELKAATLLKDFEDLPDPREERNRKHLLVDVIGIAVFAVIVGCDGPTAIRLWATEREDWLCSFLQLPNGVPSCACVRRALSLLKPEAFSKCCHAWVAESISTDAAGRLIAIDGETLPRSHNRQKGLGPLHLVSAQAAAEGLSFGQLATEEKSSEITAGSPDAGS